MITIIKKIKTLLKREAMNKEMQTLAHISDLNNGINEKTYREHCYEDYFYFHSPTYAYVFCVLCDLPTATLYVPISLKPL